ncbi:MAG: sugar phosphate isomerase/epimerase, partial [Planctomycetales bacterium]|nr:sugar phosphate isomerase/epimerase [Planctomycetales bacterium]
MPVQPAVVHGRIRQSVMAWCFKPMPAQELARHVKALGMPAIEGLDIKLYPEMRELGLDIALVGSHGFSIGMCNPQHHEQCQRILRERVDLAAEMGYQRVITFTGMLPSGMPRATAFKHCVDGFREAAAYAGKKNVTLCLEHLNTRDDTHPMKGHPGYQGDDIDYVANIVRKVGSPRVKVLFDIYHVQ